MGLDWFKAHSFLKNFEACYPGPSTQQSAAPEWSPIGRHELSRSGQSLFPMAFDW